jgi:MFS family permease
VYFPIWLQQIQHLSPTLSGFALTTTSIGWPLGATLTGALIKKSSPWMVAALGSASLVISGLLLTSINVSTPVALFFVITFIMGFGFGLSMTVFMVILQNSVEDRQRGTVMSSNALLNTLGQTIFIAIFGVVYNVVSAQDTVNGMSKGIHAVFYCVAALTVISFFITLKLPKISKEELFSKKETTV